MPAALDAKRIRAALGPELRGIPVHVYERVGSTNDAAQALLAGEPPGSFLIAAADVQENGRGRRGRSWSARPGEALLFSAAISYPPETPAPYGEWPLLAALAVRRALAAETGLAPAIKWPNDLLIRDKKVCGVLTELCGGAQSRFLVVGAGVNVTTDAAALPPDARARATSLAAEAGRAFDRNELAGRMGRELHELYAATLAGLRFSDVRREFAATCATLGRFVTIAQGGRVVAGIAAAIGDDGTLRVQAQDGSAQDVISGEIVEERDGLTWQEIFGAGTRS